MAIDSTLAPGELILAELPYDGGGQGLTITDKRVLIAKAGAAAGAMFGNKAKSFPFHAITSVEVSHGMMFGRLQITASGTSELKPNASNSDVMRAENVVQIGRQQVDLAREIARFIEEQARKARLPTTQPTIPAPAPQKSIADEIRKLSELHKEGILTDLEFATAKARLISG